jgi:hypothetical protein
VRLLPHQLKKPCTFPFHPTTPGHPCAKESAGDMGKNKAGPSALFMLGCTPGERVFMSGLAVLRLSCRRMDPFNIVLVKTAFLRSRDSVIWAICGQSPDLGIAKTKTLCGVRCSLRSAQHAQSWSVITKSGGFRLE